MKFIDVTTGEEVFNLNSMAKCLIKKRGSYLARYTSMCQYNEIVKIIIDNNNKEYPIIAPKTMKIYFGENVGRKFTPLLNYRVYSVNFNGLNFQLKNPPTEIIAQKMKKYQPSKKVQRERYKTMMSNEETAAERKKVMKNWRDQNKDHTRHYNAEYTTNRRKIDENFRIRMNLRNRIRLALKGETKGGSLEKLIGCSIEEFKAHIESMWDGKMNWDNYGSQNGNIYEGWHTDHIIACSKFDLSDVEQQKICFHYTNLQPLWGSENFQKGNR